MTRGEPPPLRPSLSSSIIKRGSWLKPSIRSFQVLTFYDSMKMPFARIKWSCDLNAVEFGCPGPLQNSFQGVKRKGEREEGKERGKEGLGVAQGIPGSQGRRSVAPVDFLGLWVASKDTVTSWNSFQSMSWSPSNVTLSRSPRPWVRAVGVQTRHSRVWRQTPRPTPCQQESSR